MPDPSAAHPEITPGCQLLRQRAEAIRDAHQDENLAVHHWLSALLERHGPMAETLAKELDASTALDWVRKRLNSDDEGKATNWDEMIRVAADFAAGRGRNRVGERDLARAVLEAAGFETVSAKSGAQSPAPEVGLPSEAPTKAHEKSPETVLRPTPALDTFGRDLTAEAASGALDGIVGRDDEVQLVIETLCRRTKRNPLLLGPAGVGKTAIVEGLAARIQAGEVPELLQGIRLIGIQPSVLVAGASMHGELEKRVKAVLQEAAQPGIVLFIDELHSVVGTGGSAGRGDLANLLKPPLARGEVACVGATTDDEYRRYIEPDGALERRFQPLRIQELSPADSLRVLKRLSAMLSKLRDVVIPESVLPSVVELSQQHMKTRHLPDKAVDLLEQTVAHVVAAGREAVGADDVESVLRRITGVPPDRQVGLTLLRERLESDRILQAEDRTALLSRLAVTTRELDLRPQRPDAIVLLAGRMADRWEAIANSVADCVFGGVDRRVVIDFGRLTEGHDVTALLGAPPGYVGYDRSLPIHRLAQMPCCVLVCLNVDSAHPRFRELLAQALGRGVITDAQGKRIHLGEMVVVITAKAPAGSSGRVGFQTDDEPPTDDVAQEILGAVLGAQIDLVFRRETGGQLGDSSWIEEVLLGGVSRRYRNKGVDLHWDDEVVGLLADLGKNIGNAREWERWADEYLHPRLIRHVKQTGRDERRVVRIVAHGGALRFDEVSEPRKGEG